MKKKRFKAEEIVNKLRAADVLAAQGRTVAIALCKVGAEPTKLSGPTGRTTS